MVSGRTRLSPAKLFTAGVLSAGVVASGGALSGLTAAEAPSAKRPSVATAEQQAADATRAAQATRTRYQAALRAVRTAEADLAGLGRRVDAAESNLQLARLALDDLASASYRTGGMTPTLSALLAEDPDSALQQASYMERIANWQAEALRRMTVARIRLGADQAAMETRLDQLAEARSTLAAQQAAMNGKEAAAAKQLASLQASLKPKASGSGAARTAGSTTSTTTATPPAPVNTGSCPPSGSRGAEARLAPGALRLMRCGLAAFPGLDFAGGYGTRGGATDHDDGRAVDFMIPNYNSAAGRALGTAVAAWAIRQPNVSYVIWNQRIYGSWHKGWTAMSNRGGDTANHRDHVHVSVTG